jgi:RNA recognition motif-containing protein
MSDIRIDRAVLTVKEDRPARTSSPIGINALSPKEDAVFKREDTSRKMFSPIGSPMAENTAVPNDGSFFSNKQAPHHIMGLFGGTSHQSSMFIRSLSPATNLGPNGKIDASNQAVVQINDLDERTNEDIARSLPGQSPTNPLNHVNKINNAKRFEPPRRRAMSLVGTAGDRFANSDWSFDPNNYNNGQNIPYDHQVYSRSIEANNPWNNNANVQQQEYYQYNNTQQYYNEQQYRAQQQQYYMQQAYQQQQQQQHHNHNYQQELSEQDEWITGMGGMDFENNDSQPKYGQHVPGFYNASLMPYQHRADTASPQQSPRYAPGVTRVTNQMSNLTLNQGTHLSTSPNYSAQSPAPTTTSTTSCLVLGVGFRSGWMGPPTGPASRSLLIYNLPQGILFTAAHSYTAMSRSGYDPSTSTMTLTASTSSSTTPSSTPPTTPSSSTAQSPMMSPFSSPRMTSINAPMLNLSIVNAESLTPSSPFSLNTSTSVADQLISLLLNFGPIRSLQFSAGNTKTGMSNSSPGGSSELFNNSPFLIVSYFDIRHAPNAVLHLHACNFKNKKLEVQYFFPKDYTSLKEQNQGTLVIFNLDPNTSNEDLKSIFGEYGEIKEIRESPNKKHKFIEFYDVRDAERAMKYLNKSEVKGKKIKIEPSRPGGPRKNMLHQLTLDVDDDLQTPHAVSTPVTPNSNSMPAPVPAPASNYQLYQGNVHYPNYASNTAPNYGSVRESEVLKSYSPLPDKSYSTPPPNSYAHHNSYHAPALVPNPNPLIAPNSNTAGHVTAKPYNHSAASNPLFFDGPGLFSLTPSISAAPNPSTEHVHNANLLSASPLDVFSSRDREFKSPSNTASPAKPAPSHATDGQTSEHVPPPNNVKSDERPIPSNRPRAHSTNAVMKSSPSLFDDLRPLQYNSDVNEDSALFDDTASTGSESQTGSNGSTTPVNGSAAPITRGRRRTHSGRMSRDEDVVRYELYVDKVLNGDDTRTTLMIKNIPNKYDQDMLLTTVDKKYRGLYDFFYLPIDFKNKCNVGYAFVNFIQPVTIAQFHEDFNNKKWEKFNSEKVCKIAYARIQGKNQLIEHFKNSSLMFEDPKCRPIIFAASPDGHTAGPQEPFPIGPNVRPRNRKDSGGRNYKYNNSAGGAAQGPNNGSPLTGGNSSTTSTSHHHKKNSRDNGANSRPPNKDLSTDKEP